MKYLVSFSFFCLFVACFSQKTYKVMSVHDGDTFEIIKNGKKQSCRIANIDAPELKQSFGINSRDSLSKLILGKEIIVDSLTMDIYNRMIVSPRVNGQNIDYIMIRNGWAWHYSIYSKSAFLEKTMNLAVSQKLGLWSCGIQGVCPPWLYRKYNRINKIKYCKSCNF
jgi:endonuclease YncB( thermonuclease family)